MNEELTLEEKIVIEKWRALGAWGSLELVKQNGKLFDVSSTNKERVFIPTRKES